MDCPRRPQSTPFLAVHLPALPPLTRAFASTHHGLTGRSHSPAVRPSERPIHPTATHLCSPKFTFHVVHCGFTTTPRPAPYSLGVGPSPPRRVFSPPDWLLVGACSRRPASACPSALITPIDWLLSTTPTDWSIGHHEGVSAR
jgi:hypothetical protein